MTGAATDPCENVRAEAQRLREAILDIDAHASPLGRDDHGFVAGGYIISVGCLHRALGAVGYTSPRCTEEPCPHNSVHDMMRPEPPHSRELDIDPQEDSGE